MDTFQISFSTMSAAAPPCCMYEYPPSILFTMLYSPWLLLQHNISRECTALDQLF